MFQSDRAYVKQRLCKLTFFIFAGFRGGCYSSNSTPVAAGRGDLEDRDTQVVAALQPPHYSPAPSTQAPLGCHSDSSSPTSTTPTTSEKDGHQGTAAALGGGRPGCSTSPTPSSRWRRGAGSGHPSSQAVLEKRWWTTTSTTPSPTCSLQLRLVIMVSIDKNIFV